MLHNASSKSHSTTIPFPVCIGNADMYTFVPVSDDELSILTGIARKIDNGQDENVEPFCDNEELSVLYSKIIDYALADVKNENGFFLLREIGICPFNDVGRFIKENYEIAVYYPCLEDIMFYCSRQSISTIL